MKMATLFARLAALTAVAALFAGFGGTAAAAAPAPAAQPEKTVTATAEMRITGFDRAVAEQHGFEIRTTADGREYSVKKGTARNAGVSTDNVVYGNCGSSYLWYDAIGGSANQIRTGFTVNQAATSYWWLVVMRDDGGQSSRNWAGGLLLRTSWGVTSIARNMTHGFSDAYVSTGSSAILWNGAVCTSGGPSDFTWTY